MNHILYHFLLTALLLREAYDTENKEMFWLKVEKLRKATPVRQSQSYKYCVHVLASYCLTQVRLDLIYDQTFTF